MASVASSPAYAKKCFDIIVTEYGTPHHQPTPKKKEIIFHKRRCCVPAVILGMTFRKMYSNLIDTTESGNLKLQTKITGPVAACIVFSKTESRQEVSNSCTTSSTPKQNAVQVLCPCIMVMLPMPVGPHQTILFR